ncbi:flagellar filament capping protein FliD [Clostridium aciditolerans]|uniref:Flagellar hook-associated protein 2 n=1 Tax=Clostridium aciditolerans TaxID=339861 RepID=A0A934HYI4_9CLOT|nr:flagellar filament capping protein FliD [Clostridium aciditolerans]MBI6872725.1 flagellar filament capping protein FliD [Clostridium aciditolerans]
MSDISSVSSNMLRITGLATGMDTDSMVKKMMAAENIRLDKMKQDRQYIQWRQDGLRDIIKDFRDLRQKYLLIDSPADTNMVKSGAYSGSTITSDNSNALTATALPGAANGASTVAVKQVASGAKVSGTKLEGIFLSSEITNGNIGGFDGGSLVINGKSVSIGSVTGGNLSEKLDTIVSNINDNIKLDPTLNGKLEVEKYSPDGGTTNYLRFKQLTDKTVTVTSAKQSDTTTDIAELSNIQNKSLNVSASTKLSDLGIENGKNIKITIPSGSATITIDNTKTVQDLINSIYNAKIGTSSDTLYSKVKVSFSELTQSLSIETRDTGSNQTISMDGSDLSILSKLGLGDGATVTSGTNAIVEITPPGAGSATKVERSTNNFVIDNVSYSINSSYKVTDTVNGDNINLTTKPDSQGSVNKIKAFVDQYNTLVQKIYDKISEKKNYNYKPLTDDQRSEMKDDQIKSWEDKAKQGVLKNDGDLQSVLNSMRSALMDGVKSAGISLSEIGIDTYGGLEAAIKPGQLKIDETKLKNALEARGDQVMKIFTATPDSSITDTTEKYNNTGIFKRVESIINNAAVKFDGTLLKKAGYVGTASEATNTITKQLNNQDKAITEMNKKLADKQEKYYQMFAKLETAMNNMNAQQSWLAQQLGSK